MAKSKKSQKIRITNTNEELLKRILITQLCVARVPQKEVAKIVGISINAVNAIAKHIKLPKG
jgi:hypothetical protein